MKGCVVVNQPVQINMQPTIKNKPLASQSSGSINPLARALAETEKSAFESSQNPNQRIDQNSLFSQALARGNGGPSTPTEYNQSDYFEQQREAEKKRKLELQRRKLHEQINPVDTIKLFDAREKKVKEELEKTRSELHALIQDIKGLYKEIDIATYQEVVNPGTDARYYVSFFQKLRAFIMMLRQKVHSARTWAQTAQSKKAKRRSKFGAGIDVAGTGHEQGKAVHDMMNQELSNVYNGG